MTNDKAVKLLHRISDSQFDGIHGDERREALEMAVRALEPNLVKESGDLVQDLVNDCISRKMAIDAFEPEHDTDWYTPQIIEVLEALPPVQPTQTNADSTHENTLDCVSRQQAIDVIKKEILERDGRFYKGLLVANHVIVHLPSAQPETHDKRTETHDKRTETQINTLDCVSRQVAIDALTELRKKTVASDSFRLGIYYSIEEIKNVPSAQLDSQEIGYWECSNALLKMWIDNVLTDGEYYRIADKLNTYWKEKIKGKNNE